MKTLPIAALLGLLMLSACSTLQTSVDFDRSVDFSKYRTYKWDNPSPPENAIVLRRFVTIVDGRLVAKGLSKADRADLLVALRTHRADETVYRTDVDRSWGYGRGWWAGNVVYEYPQQIPVGTLVLDLIDGTSNELIWRGVARRILDPMASPDEKDRNAEETVARLFEEFPPK